MPQEKEPDVIPIHCPPFLEITASRWVFTHIETGMIRANNSKTDVVVPVIRIVPVPGRATQIIRFVVPRTPAQRTGGSLTGSFPS